ncbi:MAG: N-formylglutamate deformylase [Rhodobacter sp.]|nr:N-formylglutamate deformylase [Rhodobacter sp.]
MAVVDVVQGELPLVLAMPHVSTAMPADVWAALNQTGRLLADTDWHVDRLYDGLLPGASVVKAGFHRYVIDANRDPSGESLYPGQATTGLVPTTDFDGAPIWAEVPNRDEIARRLAAFHAPYHAALSAELARVKARHGIAVLFDCHSIRSRIPRLFDGVLPVLNLGTYDGASCGGEVQSTAWAQTSGAPYPSVLNGRFKGGWATRHYGRPKNGVHALQMEIAQRGYLADEAPPWAFDDAKANALRRHLKDLLDALVETALETTP